MSIKVVMNQIENLTVEDIIKDDFVKKTLVWKGELSKSDERYLLNKIGKFREISSDTLLKYIILFSFWKPDGIC